MSTLTAPAPPEEGPVGRVVRIRIDAAREDAPLTLSEQIAAALRELAFPLALWFWICVGAWILWFVSRLVEAPQGG